jgi:phage gp36-like protein
MLEVVSAEADSYMVGRVGPLPLENVPLDLKMRCIDLAIYRMCPSADRLTNEKVDRFKAAIEWFKMVAENKIKLAVSGEAVAGSLTQKARLTTANEAACEQDEGSRWFSRRRTRVLV